MSVSFNNTALEFQYFLLWQIKCQGSYMKIHFASALPQQCFCRGWQDFILRSLAFTLATSAKTSTTSKLVRLLSLSLCFTKNKKYYVYNSIQTFKKSLVFIQSKAPSFICSIMRNNNYNPFHVHDFICSSMCNNNYSPFHIHDSICSSMRNNNYNPFPIYDK